MVRMTVLASGSKGNSTLVASSTTRILVDAGLSCREILRRMKAAGEDPAALDAILITHEHQDHVQGLAVTARRLGIPVYLTEPTHRAWVRWLTPRKRITYAEWLEQRRKQSAELRAQASEKEGGPEAGSGASSSFEPEPDAEEKAAAEESLAEPEKDPAALPAVEYFQSGNPFRIGDIAVTPFTIPHDAIDPVGFVFEVEGARLGVATDLGYIPSNLHAHLRRCDVLMLESNHDLEMLRDGPYPWAVKQRVMSRVGHLSNDAAAEFLAHRYDGHATYVVLAHLSESNNLPELARIAAERALRDKMNLLANKLVLAEQSRPLEPIVLE
jgi:phosphoribosyl 1,2-cyclic phosphodiesterase